jgi:hypothetical protein
MIVIRALAAFQSPRRVARCFFDDGSRIASYAIVATASSAVKEGKQHELLPRVGSTFSSGLLFGLLVSWVPAGAQTLSSDHGANLSLSSVLSTITANIPANVLASITSGALEVREQTNYNPQGSILASMVFVVQAGSPTPAKLSTVLFNAYCPRGVDR